MGVVSFLYSCVGLIALAGFVPQIWTLATSRSDCREMSIRTWAIWSCSWGISLAYGVLVLNDALFVSMAVINLSCHLCVTALIVRNRYGIRMAWRRGVCAC